MLGKCPQIPPLHDDGDDDDDCVYNSDDGDHYDVDGDADEDVYRRLIPAGRLGCLHQCGPVYGREEGRGLPPGVEFVSDFSKYLDIH